MNASFNGTIHDGRRFINIATACFIGIILTIGLIGNSLVLYIYAYRFKASPFNIFIIFLAVMDFIFCALDMPLEIANMTHHTEFGGCKFVVTLGTVTAVSTGQCLIAIAALRFNAVCRPLKQTISNKTARCLTIVFFFTACAVSWPAAVMLTNVHTSLGDGLYVSNCASSPEYEETIFPVIYNLFQFLLFLGAFFSICVLYCITGSRLWKRKKYGIACRSRELTSSTSSEKYFETTKSNMTECKSTDTIFSICQDEPKSPNRTFKSNEIQSNDIKQNLTQVKSNPESHNSYALNQLSAFNVLEQSKLSMESNAEKTDQSISVESNTKQTDQSSYGESNYDESNMEQTDLSKGFESNKIAKIQSNFIRSNSFPAHQSRSILSDPFSAMQLKKGYASFRKPSSDCPNQSNGLIQYGHIEQTNIEYENPIYHERSVTNEDDQNKSTSLTSVGMQSSENLHQSSLDVPVFNEEQDIIRPPDSNMSYHNSDKTLKESYKNHPCMRKKVSTATSIITGSNRLDPVKMLVIMALIFFVSYVPHLSLMIYIETGLPLKLVPVSESVIGIIIRSYFLGSVCNPILYGCYNRKFREEVKSIWKTFKSRINR